jgi:hypothetical protein
MSSSSTELTNTAYDILKVLGKDADFLYDTDAYAQGSFRKRDSWINLP